MSDDLLKQMRDRNNPMLVKMREFDVRLTRVERAANGNNDVSEPIHRLYSDCYMSAALKIVTIIPRESGQISLYGDNGFDEFILPDSITLDFASGTSGRKHAIYLSVDPIATATVTDNAKIVAEFEAWTNETTRATALDNVQGVLLKNGDYSKRWIGDAYYDGTLVSVMGGVDPLSGAYFGTGDPNNAGANATGTGQQQPGILVNNNRLNIFTVAAGLFKFGVSFVNALFGNDISDPNKTGFSIFFSAQTYNGESMEAGAVMFGSNTAGYANILWSPSNKILYFRGGTTNKLWINTTGNIYLQNNQFITFLDASSGATAGIARDASNDVIIQNNTASAGITMGITMTDASSPRLSWDEDTGNANVALLQVNSGTAGSKLTVGQGVTIWADKDATETVFNENSKNIDLRVEGDTDANLLFTDASTDRVGIGMNAPARKLDVTGTFGATGAATFGSTVAATGAVTGSNLSGTNTGDQTLKTPIYSSGLAGTVAGSSTAYLGMHPQAANATEANVQAQAPFTGTKKLLRLRTLTAQPAGGSMVVTLRIGAADTGVTFTIAAGAAAGTFADTTNSAAVTAAQAESIKCVNNAAGASAQIGQYSMEYDAS